MKSTLEMRLFNLLILIDETDSRTAFANKAKALEFKIDYGYIGQLVNKNRGIGNSVARKLEIMGNKPTNWLDHPHYKKWFELELITEEDIQNDEDLKEISFLSHIREPENHIYDKNKNLDKTSALHKYEIEQLIQKITFIYSQKNHNEDVELIKKIITMVFDKHNKK